MKLIKWCILALLVDGYPQHYCIVRALHGAVSNYNICNLYSARTRLSLVHHPSQRFFIIYFTLESIYTPWISINPPHTHKTPKDFRALAFIIDTRAHTYNYQNCIAGSRVNAAYNAFNTIVRSLKIIEASLKMRVPWGAAIFVWGWDTHTHTL